MDPAPVSLLIDILSCTACSACELACSFSKLGYFSPSHSRIQILQVFEDGVNVPIFCTNCESSPCMEVCPSEAIVRDNERGIVSIESDFCTACGECVEVCPYGAIHIPENNDIALICDLCGGDPVCVPSCIYGALTYEQRPDIVFLKIAQDFSAVPNGERSWAVAEYVAAQLRIHGEVKL